MFVITISITWVQRVPSTLVISLQRGNKFDGILTCRLNLSEEIRKAEIMDSV